MTSNIKNKLSAVLVPSALIIIGIISFSLHKWAQNPQIELTKIQKILDNDFSIFENYIIGKEDQDFSVFPAFMNIEVLKGDSLVFWSSEYSRKFNLQEFDFDYTVNDPHSDRFGHIFQNIFQVEDSLMNPDLIREARSLSQFKNNINAIDESFDLTIGNRIYHVTPTHFFITSISFSIFIVSTLLLYFIFLFYVSHLFARREHISKYLTSVIFLRLILLVIEVSTGWKDGFLFSESNDLSIVHSSLGQLFVNGLTAMVVLMYLFRISYDVKIPSRFHLFINVVNGVILSFLFIYYCFVSKGFIINENIQLDPGKFLSMNLNGILLITGLILGIGLLFFYALFSLQFCKKFAAKSNVILGHAIGLLLSSLLYPLFISIHPVVLGAFIIALVIMIDLFIDSRQKNVVWIIWWIVVLSGFLTALIYYYNFEKDKTNRIKYIQNTYTESRLNQIQELDSIHAKLLLSSIPGMMSTVHHPAILDKKDLKAYLQDVLPIEKLTSLHFDQLYLFDKNKVDVFSNSNNKNSYIVRQLSFSQAFRDHLYYNPFEGMYIMIYELDGGDHPYSPFLFAMTFKHKPRQTTIPDDIVILKNSNIIHPQIPNYSGTLIDYMLQVTDDFHFKGYSGVVWSPNNEYTIISLQQVGGLIKPMSLFSYLFTITGMIVLILLLGNHYKEFIPFPIPISIFERRSLRSRIQINIISLIIFSFVTVGFLTAYYFKNILEENSEKNNNHVLINLLQAINGEILSSDSETIAMGRTLQTVSNLEPLLSNQIYLYDQNGNQLNISGKDHNLEMRIPFEIFRKIRDKREATNKEDNGYTNIEVRYIPLYFGSDRPFAYIGVKPEEKTQIKDSILDFLSTLLNVYVFLFLLAGAIAIAISNSITKPLGTLTDKLRAFKLGKTNEPLEWNRDDEIGTLIKDYNNLIIKLEESAYIIAKTERDTAWREMAKQVAHEIKNPLTPMKLSIQYLQKALDSNVPNIEPLMQRVSTTLLEQINNLSEIANEFSNFGKMPQSNNEKIVINELVEAVHDLFRKREDMDIFLSEPITDLHVFADRGQLIRIFNNLIKNAIQAIPENRRGKIEISLHKKGKNAVVKFSDNGIGIPEEMKSKVFTPNFTTKSSGTGLGLAISANIIDGFNGKIYFESVEDRGTDFYVEIPLMRLEEKKDERNRVVLE